MSDDVVTQAELRAVEQGVERQISQLTTIVTELSESVRADRQLSQSRHDQVISKLGDVKTEQAGHGKMSGRDLGALAGLMLAGIGAVGLIGSMALGPMRVSHDQLEKFTVSLADKYHTDAIANAEHRGRSDARISENESRRKAEDGGV